MANRIGQQFGNYRLVRLLGQGGAAEVYLGEHVEIAKRAAIKILHDHITDEDIKVNFCTEARLIAVLAHPHIIPIVDFGVEQTTPYLVMDYAPKGQGQSIIAQMIRTTGRGSSNSWKGNFEE